MADEIKVSVILDVNDTKTGSVRLYREYLKQSFDMSGSKAVTNIQNIGTSAEAIDIGDITTPGYMIVKNLDATNFVEIRDGSAGADVIKIKAGEVQLFRLATTTPFGIAATAPCTIDYAIVED